MDKVKVLRFDDRYDLSPSSVDILLEHKWRDSANLNNLGYILYANKLSSSVDII